MSPPPPSLPLCIALQLTDRPVTLVGGGKVASGRLDYLLQARAQVTLISPRAGLCHSVLDALEAGKIYRYFDRIYAGNQDLEGAFMVLTAVDDQSVGQQVAQFCCSRSILVNVADVPSQCDFYFGSIVRRGPLQIMVSTNGKAPRLAAQLRRTIDKILPANLERTIENVDAIRTQLRARASGHERSAERMGWMTQFCDRWTWAELASLDNNQIEMILKSAWDDDPSVVTTNTPRKVLTKQMLVPWWRRNPLIDGWRRCPMSSKWDGSWLGPGSLGLILGATVSALYVLKQSAKA